MSKIDVYHQALSRVKTLLNKAKETNIHEPTAMTLVTSDAAGHPSARTVLLKNAEERGFVFYTNANSRKGTHLIKNPKAALLFKWHTLPQKIVIEGHVEKIAEAESDLYWKTRPRLSQLGAWASKQSRPIAHHRFLILRFLMFWVKYWGRRVPRPRHWYGFRVIPSRLEFWDSNEEGTIYEKVKEKWFVHKQAL